MPRDKTHTHQKLLKAIRSEFLKEGYEKASIRNIAKETGITPAGIYRHFSGKEAMFEAMVEPVCGDFLKEMDRSMEETYERLSDEDFILNFNAFRTEKNTEAMNYAYDHFEEFHLLLVASKGTSYEGFEERLVESEEKSIRDLFRVLEKRHIPHKDVTDRQLHILCTMFIAAFCEPIRHGYTRAEALEHCEFVGKLMYPGIQNVLGI